jgi:hypothetical protein
MKLCLLTKRTGTLQKHNDLRITSTAISKKLKSACPLSFGGKNMTFSSWKRWPDRNEYYGISFPGVYVVAISDEDLSGLKFSYLDDIVYVGMTNAVKGLRGRLSQFDNTISKKHWQHGGADRLLFKHRNYKKLINKLYISMQHWECDPSQKSASDLLTMGEVLKMEFVTMAKCIQHRPCKQIPVFNDMKNSPKYTAWLRKNG